MRHWSTICFVLIATLSAGFVAGPVAAQQSEDLDFISDLEDFRNVRSTLSAYVNRLARSLLEDRDRKAARLAAPQQVAEWKTYIRERMLDALEIQCLLAGDNLARYTIWDGMRALNYLLSRPEVDATRIACTGNSGGGTHTAYLSALDDRIHVAAPSCYLTS